MPSERESDIRRTCAQRIVMARMRMLATNGFFGVLLMHAKFALNSRIERARISGDTIEFSPAFLGEITDSELGYVLMHEVLHLALQHERRCAAYGSPLFDKACDIVVNSIILECCHEDEHGIYLHCAGGVQPHLSPDGREGREFSAEELYLLMAREQERAEGEDEEPGSGAATRTGERTNRAKSAGKGGSNEAGEVGREGAGSAEQQDNSGSGKAPRGKRLRTADENMRGASAGRWDEHVGNGGRNLEMPGDSGELPDSDQDAVWTRRILNACEIVSRKGSVGRGTVPAFAQRLQREAVCSQADWRTLLANFVQEEVCDYSFAPPDRRFSDSPFFLPDFNDTDTAARNILFMVDASGSMSEAAVRTVYSEVKGALDQFNGKLSGWLGFFDATVSAPEPFESEEELDIIRPKGGGGTSFGAVFDYVRAKMQDVELASIIILTDGYAPFPTPDAAQGVPVLWVITNDSVQPPWGKVARVQVDG